MYFGTVCWQKKCIMEYYALWICIHLIFHLNFFKIIYLFSFYHVILKRCDLQINGAWKIKLGICQNKMKIPHLGTSVFTSKNTFNCNPRFEPESGLLHSHSLLRLDSAWLRECGRERDHRRRPDGCAMHIKTSFWGMKSCSGISVFLLTDVAVWQTFQAVKRWI